MIENRRDGSRELLAAYVDGQLGRDEREYVLMLLEREPDLNRCAWELRQLKDLVQFAYDGSVAPSDLSSPLRGGA